MDSSRNRAFPTITQTAGADMGNLNNYTTATMTQPDRSGKDSVLGGRLNVKRDFSFSLPPR